MPEPASPPEGKIRPNQGHSRRGLITGFGPFPGVPRNPSEVLAKKLAVRAGWKRLGWEMRLRAFPTRYGDVPAIIREEARIPPAFVVMLGVAAREKWVRVEKIARNRVSMTQNDEGARSPRASIIAPGAPAIRRGRHPDIMLVNALRRTHVPARTSLSAGRYVCNFAYWHMIEAMSAKTDIVFVHIPLPMDRTRKRDPRRTIEEMERGLTALLRVMIRRARIRP